MRTNAAKQYNGRKGFSLVAFPCLVSHLELEMPNWHIPCEKVSLKLVQHKEKSEQ